MDRVTLLMEVTMFRILAVFAAVALGGCVITPDYRYADGYDYYYGVDGYAGVTGVYGGAYGAGSYYHDCGIRYYAYARSWPWYANGCAGYGFGWNDYWGFGGNPWGSYWSSWAYAPHYYWVVDSPNYRYRDLEALHAEKVRYVGRHGGVDRGAASIATMNAARASQMRSARNSRRDTISREAVRRPVRAPVDVQSRYLRGDAFRHQVTRPDVSGWPASEPVRSKPAPTISRLPVHRTPSRPTVTRMPSAPTRSYRPAPRIRATPVTRTRHSSNARSSTPRSYPRGKPHEDD